MEASLQEILHAREQRVQIQKQLLAHFQKPLLCFTMNIPGPQKLNRDVSIGFAVGNWLLCDALDSKQVLHTQIYRRATGCESFYVVDMPATELKKLALELEEIQPIGRLFDMDVLDVSGEKISRETLGYPRRKCLLCDNDAAVCGRSRTHRLEDLQDRTSFLLYLAAREWMAEYVAAQAFTALNQEVTTTPKPGLVDGNNPGAHKDMGLKHFFASAICLRPYFCRFAETGFLTRDQEPYETFCAIRPIGIEAERTMMKATGGVNTHKGAIFSLGLLCAAAGRLDPAQWNSDALLEQCAAMTAGLVARELSGITEETAKTAGERLYAQYGISGVRGQAEAGFPAVKKVGLPIFNQALAQGHSVNDAGSITLLHLLAATDDTNLIHRSNRQTQLSIKQQISDLLHRDPFPPLSVMEALDREFIEKNLSPGGSADLLAMTYFLHFLQPRNLRCP